MRRQQLYRHSSQCHDRCVPGPQEDIYSHQDNKLIRHEYIRSKHLDEHFKKYQAFMQQNLASIEVYRQTITDRIVKIRNELNSLEREVQERIKGYIQSFEGSFWKGEKDKFLVSTIKDFNFDALSCFEMGKLIKLTDVSFLSGSQNKLKVLNDRKIQQIEQLYEQFVKRVFKHSKIEVVSSNDINLLNIIKLNQSTIVKDSNQSLVSDDFGDLKGTYDQLFPTNNSKYTNPPLFDMSKKQAGQNALLAEIGDDEQQFDIIEEEEEESYYAKNKSIKMAEQKVRQEEPKQQDKTQKEEVSPKAQEQAKEEKKARTRYKKKAVGKNVQSDPEQYSQQDKEDNQQEINTTAAHHSSEAYSSTSKILQQSELLQDYCTISDLDDILQSADDITDYQFNMRVKVVKVLYYCIIFQKRLKMKFIAGDETGLGVFFTNYWNEIKPGCQLELTDCKFTNFKESIEIANDKNFKIINSGRQSIVANLDGILLTEYIEKDGQELFYSISDKNCRLIRTVADRLSRKNLTRIHRMIVKVVFILNEWNSGVFCQVGDSSGLMLAYIKKQKAVAITEGSVIKLTHLTGKKGEEPNKMMKGEIIYIDAYSGDTKVVPFKPQFLQISDRIMSV